MSTPNPNGPLAAQLAAGHQVCPCPDLPYEHTYTDHSPFLRDVQDRHADLDPNADEAEDWTAP